MRVGWLEDGLLVTYRSVAIAATLIGGAWLASTRTHETPPQPPVAHTRPAPVRAEPAPRTTDRVRSSPSQPPGPRAGSPTLEDILKALVPSSISAASRSKLAASLDRLSDRFDVFDRVAARSGVSADLLATIATLESDGGRYLYPFAYRAQVERANRQGTPLLDTVPRGYTHVMPATLDGALRQARAARAYFSGFGARWRGLEQRSWHALRDRDRYLASADLTASRLHYGSMRERDRNLMLVATVPDIVEPDPMRLEGSLLATATVTAYNAAAIETQGLRLDMRTLLLAYVAGSGYVPRVSPPGSTLSNAEFVGRVREFVGADAAWYVETGLAMFDELHRYPTLAEARVGLKARAAVDR